MLDWNRGSITLSLLLACTRMEYSYVYGVCTHARQKSKTKQSRHGHQSSLTQSITIPSPPPSSSNRTINQLNTASYESIVNLKLCRPSRPSLFFFLQTSVLTLKLSVEVIIPAPKPMEASKPPTQPPPWSFMQGVKRNQASPHTTPYSVLFYYSGSKKNKPERKKRGKGETEKERETQLA